MGLIQRLVRRPVTPPPGAELPPGIVIQWPGETPPAGYIKLNGAGVEVALYPELDAALWVGAGRNATAEAFYRFTSLGDPSGSRATLGAYLKLLDMRAQFARGWDDGRGIDPGRVLGSSQLDAMQGHWHMTPRLWQSNNAGGFNNVSNDWNGGGTTNYVVRQAISDGVNGTPRVAAETRPRNVALLYCIKI